MNIADITVTNGHIHVDLSAPRNSKHATELYGEKKGLLNMQHPSTLIALQPKQLYGNIKRNYNNHECKHKEQEDGHRNK